MAKGSLEFHSSYTLAESVDRLRLATGAGSDHIVANIAPTRVVLYRHHRGVRNPLKPVFRGAFFETQGDVVLRGRFSTFRVISFFLSLWFLGAAAFTVAAISAMRLGSPDSWFPPATGLALAAVGLGIVALSRRLGRADRRVLETMIADALDPSSSVAQLTYDPTWLVELIGSEFPDERALAAELATCTHPLRVTPAYISFVDASCPNAPGSDWQFGRNVVLEQSPEGMVVIDVLKDGRIGGIEFPDRVRV